MEKIGMVVAVEIAAVTRKYGEPEKKKEIHQTFHADICLNLVDMIINAE